MKSEMEATHEVSVKCIPFDGTQEKFRMWKNKVLSHAQVKGFSMALESDLGPLISQEQYLESRLEMATTTTTRPQAAAVAVPDDEATAAAKPTKMQILKYKMNVEAFGFLMLSCTKAAYGFVEVHKTKDFPQGNAYRAWQALLKRYESSNVGSDYVELNSKFAECKLNGLYTDPDEWFQNMDYYNNRLAMLGDGKYAKDEFAMKVHIMGSLPKEYESIKTKYDGVVEDTPMSDLQRDIVNYWKRNGKKSSSNNSDKNQLAMATSKFKGKCHKCGKQGHRAKDCRSKPSEGKTDKSEKVVNQVVGDKKDKSKIKCFNCGEMGHYANKCPKGKDGIAKHGGETNNAISNMFVCVAIRNDINSDHQKFESTMMSDYSDDSINRNGGLSGHNHENEDDQ